MTRNFGHNRYWICNLFHFAIFRGFSGLNFPFLKTGELLRLRSVGKGAHAQIALLRDKGLVGTSGYNDIDTIHVDRRTGDNESTIEMGVSVHIQSNLRRSSADTDVA